MGQNCEVGAAQRACGAEPLDLFRWAGTPITLLLKLLDTDFADLDNITIVESGPEYMIRHNMYPLNWHTWTNPKQMSAEAVLSREKKRLPFLADKLREDLREGYRIFVVTRRLQIDDGLAKGILRSMERYGNPTLMFVNDGQAVSATRISDRLIKGYIPKFAPGNAVLDKVSATDWTQLCRRALALQTELPPSQYQKGDHSNGTLLSLGKPANQSSVSKWSRKPTTSEDAAGAVSGSTTGSYQFHTAAEQQPWWQVDLLALCRIRGARIYNRLDAAPERSAHFRLLVSADCETWSEVFRRETGRPYGGVDGDPFVWTAKEEIIARYFRIALFGLSNLHLDQVEVFGDVVP